MCVTQALSLPQENTRKRYFGDKFKLRMTKFKGTVITACHNLGLAAYSPTMSISIFLHSGKHIK